MGFVYVVFSVINKQNKPEFQLERIEESVWEAQRLVITPERIKYVTLDLFDEELAPYNFKEIVWDRYYDKSTHNHRKIIVPYTNDYVEMDEAADVEFNRIFDEIRDREALKEAKRLEKYENTKITVKKRESAEKIVEGAKSEEEAVEMWRKEGCPLPAPHIIVELKREANMSWPNFIKSVRDYYNNLEIDKVIKANNLDQYKQY